MEQKSLFWKNSIKHGIIIGLGLIIYSVILYVLELNLNNVLNNLSYLILIAGFYFGTKAYRDKELNGHINYGKAFGYSMIILLIAAIISNVYGYIFMKFIDPDIVEKIKALSEEKMLERGMSDEQVEMSMKMQSKFMSPGIMMIFGFVWYMIFGTILALLTSIFVKKQGDPYQSAMQDIEE